MPGFIGARGESTPRKSSAEFAGSVGVGFGVFIARALQFNTAVVKNPGFPVSSAKSALGNPPSVSAGNGEEIG
jgi:hypothetical protein